MDDAIIKGGLSVDDRGFVGFNNDFDMRNVRRYYYVSNHQAGTVRAFHAHEFEHKYVSVLQGAALIALVRVDDVHAPDKDEAVAVYTLSEYKPSVIHLPCGHANGSMSLTDDALLIYFSTSTLEESLGDDYRYPADFWGNGVWEVEAR